MVLVRDGAKPSVVYVARFEENAPDEGDVIITCYNSHDNGAIASRRFKPVHWSDELQLEFFGDSPPSVGQYQPYTNLVCTKDIVVSGFELLPDGRLPALVLSQLEQLKLKILAPRRRK
jgi:hypothetical protein